MISADDCYRETLNRLIVEGSIRGSNAMLHDQVLTFSSDLSLLPHSVGYDDQRWARLVFQYIEPRSFDKFLSTELDHQEISYTFPVFAMHGRGNCLLALTARKGQLTAYSRTCLFAPTGLMDITLLCLIARHFKIKKIRWHLSSIFLNETKSYVAYLNLGIKTRNSFVNQMERVKPSNWNSSRWREKALGRKTKTKIPDLYSYKEFIREGEVEGTITPESLAKRGKLGPKGGLKIRNFLREEQLFFRWGSAQNFLGEDCWKWQSFSDPMVKLIMAKFKIRED